MPRLFIRQVSVFSFLCLFCAVVVAWPLTVESVAPQASYSKEVHDAVQDERIRQLEDITKANNAAIATIESKMNWMLGGIAGIYGLMALIGFFNANLLKRK